MSSRVHGGRIITSVEASCDLDGWLDYLKQPDDTLECIIKLTNAPGWIYAAFVFITFSLGWWQFATRRARELKRAHAKVRARTTSMQQWIASAVVSAAMFLAASHTLARFSEAIWLTYHNQISTNSTRPLMRHSSDYVKWLTIDSSLFLTRATAWTLIVGLLIVMTLLYATLTEFLGLLSAMTVLLRSIQFLAIGIGIVSTIPILTVLVDQKLPAAVTALLYCAWLAALALLSFSAERLEDAGKAYG
jgi:hypothetical protein